MYFLRAFDEKIANLSLQGRVGVYTPLKGQEAAQVGAGLALGTQDWVVPTFRDMGVLLQRGVSPEHMLLFWAGFEEGNVHDTRNLPITAPVATQLPHAVGLAWSEALCGSQACVLACLGDGATSKGDFHESMNLAAVQQLPVIFLCQNNQWAISTPPSKQMAIDAVAQRADAYGMPAHRVDGNDVAAVYQSVAEATSRARAGEGPTFIEAVTYRLGGHSSQDASHYRNVKEELCWAQLDPLMRTKTKLLERGLWSEQQQRSWESHCQQLISEACEHLKAKRGALSENKKVIFDFAYETAPTSLAAQKHACLSAQHDIVTEHTRPPIPNTWRREGEGQSMNMVSALQLALGEVLDASQEVLLMGQDIGALGGVFRVTEGLQARYGERRVVDMPLSESAIVGSSIGLSLGGYRAVCEVQFAGFLYSAFEQLISHAARFRSRTQGSHSVPMVCRAAYGGGVHTPESHADSPEAHFLHVPGVKVVVPRGPRMARALLHASIQSDDPVLFLEPIPLYRSITEHVPSAIESFPLGRAEILRGGKDVTIVSYGTMLHQALKAATQLQHEHGLEAEVIDLVTISPPDIETIAASFARTRRLVTVHESPRTGGVGAEIVAQIAELYGEVGCFARVAGWDTPIPFPAREQTYLPNVSRIVQAVCGLCTTSRP